MELPSEVNRSESFTSISGKQGTGATTSKDLFNDNGIEKDEVVTLPEDIVLIAGAGPVGLLLATVLSRYGVKAVLLERNQTTTKWPKMDLTNARSMEQFRRLGLADKLRTKGVPCHIPSPVLISSGLSQPRAITAWKHPSVDEYRKNISLHNDGTMPLEPWQRISQSVFEAWLKTECDADPLIDPLFGWKVERAEEMDDVVRIHATEVLTGRQRVYISKYLIGCDGASSKTRTNLAIPLDGGPTPGYAVLIHFKSKDLARLHAQGQFWHIFFAHEKYGLGGAIIAQDEVDTWTIHMTMPLEVDHTKLDAAETVAKVLGGINGPYPIRIDEVLVRSTYRPYIAVARSYRSAGGRIFLAGDACHQNIPTGGYGMNMGLGDAFDLGWKLAATINGFGGPGLLESYEQERRPVALKLVERSGVHMGVHGAMAELLKPNPAAVDADTDEGRAMRKRIHDHYQANDGENKDLGVEMGYRYQSIITISNHLEEEPEWSPSRYTPTTWPGGRAPHVFLSDGTAIFDLYGNYYSLVEFSDGETDLGAKYIIDEAKTRNMPLKHIKLVGENHAHQIWERPLVLVRPDGHISWRGYEIDSDTAKSVVAIATGHQMATEALAGAAGTSGSVPFSATTGMTTQDRAFEIARMGEFQK